jgi:hypothetical protein
MAKAKAGAAKKKAATKKAAAPKKKKLGAFDKLVAFLETSAASPVGKAPPTKELDTIVSLAKRDPRVEAFINALIAKKSFCVFDVEAYADQLLRGKRNEPWNAGGTVVTAKDLCLARNGAGDIYVWNADDGKVRFLVHDEGWRASSHFANVDAFVEEVMQEVIESIDAEALDDVDETYLARLGFALAIAGDSSLDDEARDKLGELGVI